ncbi:hypothetical protein LZ009_09280 [Ramlibacter sp. XY19]|uniref:hypothetical protein n=1 Tax=Ramlibacter paludis TaxID=2908000 RepID=UPI0023DC8A9D|nr:hypothetical protein [Ramlibacter paludis]MCG2592971.1 hypothetical protein [Ramlibacter paludis]
MVQNKSVKIISAAHKRSDGGSIITLVKNFGHEVLTVMVRGEYCQAVSVADNSFGGLSTREVELTAEERNVVLGRHLSLAHAEVTAAKEEVQYWQARPDYPNAENLVAMAEKQLAYFERQMQVASSAVLQARRAARKPVEPARALDAGSSRSRRGSAASTGKKTVSCAPAT